jgi:hypothetical protein
MNIDESDKEYFDNPIAGIELSLKFIPGSWLLFDGKLYPEHRSFKLCMATDNTNVVFAFPEQGYVVRKLGAVFGVVNESR